MGAAAAAGEDDVVLAQADAARAALRGAGRGDEISPAGLAHEVAAAGRLGLWDRVAPIAAKAMRSPSLRGVAGSRLYATLISATAACGRPERGLEIFREMEAEASMSLSSSSATGGRSPGVGPLDDGTWEGGPAGGGGGGARPRGGGGGGRLPPLDVATFLAALDACAAVGGKESAKLAVGVTETAAGVTKAGGEERAKEGAEVSSPAEAVGTWLSGRKLIKVLEKASEVCAAAGAASAAESLTSEAARIAESASGDVGGGSGGGSGGGRVDVNTEVGVHAARGDERSR